MSIIIKNCSTNNLKNISVEIPLNKITCIVGPSGSGKSSLAFHTLANESKRRFLNSMPSSVNFFDRVPQSAVVEKIYPVLPVWLLEQNNPIVGSRLNLADQLELSMDIASLYYVNRVELCPIHEERLVCQEYSIFSEIADSVGVNEVVHFFISKDVYEDNLSGYPVRSYTSEDREVRPFNVDDEFWELFRVKSKSLSKAKSKLDEFQFLVKNNLSIFVHSKNLSKFYRFNKSMSCMSCIEEELVAPSTVADLLPFNGVGACSECKGYGSTLDYSRDKLAKFPHNSLNDGALSILEYSKFRMYKDSFLKSLKKRGVSLNEPFYKIEDEVWDFLFDGVDSFPGLLVLLSELELKKYKRSVRIFLRSIQTDSECSLCYGTRVGDSAYYYRNRALVPSYGEFLLLTVKEALGVLEDSKLNNSLLLQRLKLKLATALNMGLGELKLRNKLKFLDTGEYQKSLLVRYLSFKGSGSLFVLDEPTLGLTKDSQVVLMKYLRKLSEKNTVVLVDHSDYIQKKSDHIIEVGPGAGHLGGSVEYQGKYRKKKSIESEFNLEVPVGNGNLTVNNISFDETEISKLKIRLKAINIIRASREYTAKRVVCDVIANDLYLEHFGKKLNYDIKYEISSYGKYESFKDIIIYHTSVDRASGRSTVGTMLGLTTYARKYFANLEVSKRLGLAEGHFSPNSDLGKCKTCEGKGVVSFDMQFMEDLVFPCEDCGGKKLNPFYANISDGNITVHEAYKMPILELFQIVPQTPKVKRQLEYLKTLNLQYLTLDRTLPSLSGGERMRVRFMNTLQKNMNNCLLIFTGLSHGLSASELVNIEKMLIGLCLKGNTIIAIDNHDTFNKFNRIEIT